MRQTYRYREHREIAEKVQDRVLGLKVEEKKEDAEGECASEAVTFSFTTHRLLKVLCFGDHLILEFSRIGEIPQPAETRKTNLGRREK